MIRLLAAIMFVIAVLSVGGCMDYADYLPPPIDNQGEPKK